MRPSEKPNNQHIIKKRKRSSSSGVVEEKGLVGNMSEEGETLGEQHAEEEEEGDEGVLWCSQSDEFLACQFCRFPFLPSDLSLLRSHESTCVQRWRHDEEPGESHVPSFACAGSSSNKFPDAFSAEEEDEEEEGDQPLVVHNDSPWCSQRDVFLSCSYCAFPFSPADTLLLREHEDHCPERKRSPASSSPPPTEMINDGSEHSTHHRSLLDAHEAKDTKCPVCGEVLHEEVTGLTTQDNDALNRHVDECYNGSTWSIHRNNRSSSAKKQKEYDVFSGQLCDRCVFQPYIQ
jgi:hypothetical protein